jgi:hypothetical protein
VAAPTKRAGWQVLLALTNPYTAESFPVKKEESTMPSHTITNTHTKGETPYAVVNLTPNDITPRDWTFLKQWAEKLGLTIDVLLKRILLAGIEGQLYAERIPEI